MKESNNQKTVSVLTLLKAYKKVISFVMLISILWVSGPLQIVDAFTEKIDYSFAETNDKFLQTPDYDTTSSNDFNPQEILIDSEVESERTANSKTFKKSDGTFETVIYNKNVHFNNNGVYENIDNRLVLDSKSNNYTNKNNLYKIQFPDYLQESNDINLIYDSYSISWSTRNILSAKANVEESISNKSIKDANTTTQAMTYYEIAKGVDLEYILDSNTIKENIILKNYTKDYSISFEYKTEGLILSQNDQYEWVLVNEEKQAIFKFADFVMIDELGNQSKDITIDIGKISEDSFLLTVKPDNVWLEKANYPVKIDPTLIVIAPQNNELVVKDKFVWGLDGVHDNVAPYIPSEIILKVGNNSSNNQLYRSYVKVNNLSIPDNSFLTYAKLNLIAKATSGQQSGLNVQIKEVDILIHDFYDIEGINNYSFDKTIDNTNISPYLPDLVTWDVTEILQQAISEDQTQLIMELSLMDESLDSYIEFHSVYSNFYSDGYRIRKIIQESENIQEISYKLLDDKVIYETDGTYEIINYYDVDGAIISFYYDEDINDQEIGKDYYYLKNIFGDITQLVDNDGRIVVEYRYDAFGNTISIKEYNDQNLLTALNIALINQYRYRGYRYDSEVNLYYLNSRYYNPETARFINADGIIGQVGNIQSTNMFAYCANNPVMFTDSTGYAPKWIQAVKDWFEEEYIEIFVSLAISFFTLSYILPNGFAFASTATLGSMIGGFITACFYVAIVTIAVYGVIKLVQYFSEQDITYSNSDLAGGYPYEVYI